MKISRLIIFFSVFAMLVSCSKDETPTPTPEGEETSNPDTEEEPQEPVTEVYFTLNTFVLPTPGEPSEKWVILHDSNGELLDYKAYEAGDKLEFEAFRDSLTSTFSVSYLDYIEPNGQKIYSIRTTTNLELGYIENFGPYEEFVSETFTNTGDFDVLIEYIPNPNGVAWPAMAEISSGRGRLGTSGGGAGYSYGIELELKTVGKFEGFDDYFISILDHNNDLKYYYFDNPLADDISLDYRLDFKPIEKDISFVLPAHKNYYLNIAGFKENQDFNQYGGYWLHDKIFGELPTNPLRFGYTDIFPRYRTLFSIQMEGYNYALSHYGKPLNALNVPNKPNFETFDTSVNTFQFETDLDFLSASHSWSYVDNSANPPISRTSWSLFAEKGYEPKIGSLPTEILERYPSLNIDLLVYKSTIFNLPLKEGAEYLSNHTLTVLNQ